MNNDKLYLLSEEDYIKHINEKVYLYSLVKQLTHHIGKLSPNRGTKTLSDMAKHYGASAEKLFRSWGIPMSYLVFAEKDDLATVMENELIEPEDAGYFCDDSFCCGNCECCCDGECEDDEDENAEEFEEMMAALSAIVHSIFGDDVTFHITVD